MTEMPSPSPEQHQPDPQQPAPGTTRPGELLERFVARLVDGLLLGVAYILLSLIFTPVFLGDAVDSAGDLFLYYVLVSVLWTAVAIGYFAVMESRRGQSVGKMLMRLRTVGPDGTNPTLEQGIRRNIFYAFELLAILPVVGFWLGPLASLVAVILIAVGINSDTDNRQGWHDRFAGGTRVIKAV